MIFLISIVNYIVIYDSCGAAADAVHPSNPLHLIVCFGLCVHALTLCRLFYEPEKHFFYQEGRRFYHPDTLWCLRVSYHIFAL